MEVETLEVAVVSNDAVVTEVESQAQHVGLSPGWVCRASQLLRRGKMSTERIATQVRRVAQANGEEISQDGFDSLLEDEQIPEAYALQLQDELGL